MHNDNFHFICKIRDERYRDTVNPVHNLDSLQKKKKKRGEFTFGHSAYIAILFICIPRLFRVHVHLFTRAVYIPGLFVCVLQAVCIYLISLSLSLSRVARRRRGRRIASKTIFHVTKKTNESREMFGRR